MKKTILFLFVFLFLVSHLFFVRAAEPTPPANAILIQNFNSGNLANGSSYLYENFDRYTDVNNMQLQHTLYSSPKTAFLSPGQNPNVVYFLVTGRGGTGTAVRVYFDTAQQQSDWGTPMRQGVGSEPLTPYPSTALIVVQFYFRFPDANGIMNGGKFFELSYPGSSRIELSIKTGNPRYWVANAGTDGSEVGKSPLAHPSPDDTNDGQWHRMTIEYRPNSAGGGTYGGGSSEDGIFRGWLDGTKIIDISNESAGKTPSGGSKTWCETADIDSMGSGASYQIDHLTYPNVVNAMTAPFNIDYDDIKVWVTNNTNDTASTNTADFNADNVVNKTDILTIIYWILGIDRTNSAVDLDGNGVVNIFDLVNASRLFGKQYGVDSTQPAIILSRPANNTNLSAGTTSVVLFFETNEKARCRYLNQTGGSFATMNNFTRDGSISHSITLNGLSSGTIYNYYVQCNDTAGNLNSTNYYITFGVNATSNIASGCDNPHPGWLACDDFENGSLGWSSWFTQSPWVECDGCSGGVNDPGRIQLNTSDVHAGNWSLYLPAAASSGYQGAALTWRDCQGSKQAGCTLTNHDELYFRVWVKLASDHQTVHHFLSLGGTTSTGYWDGDGTAGCRPTGYQNAGTTLDMNSNHQLMWYTYYPTMHCDAGEVTYNPNWYCSGSFWANLNASCSARGMGSSTPECCYGNVFSPSPTVTLSLNQWVCLELHMKLNTPGQGDSVMEFWMNDQLMDSETGIQSRNTTAVGLNKAWLQHYIASGDASQSNRAWFDDVVVSTQRIGCGS